MQPKTIEISQVFHIEYNVRSQIDVVLQHIQHQLFATAIIESHVSGAVLQGLDLPSSTDGTWYAFPMLQAFGALLCGRVDHAIKLLPVACTVVDGFSYDYTDNYIVDVVLPRVKSDHNIELVKSGDEWQVYCSANVTCLGQTYTDHIEIGHAKGRYVRRKDMSNDDLLMYEATARVWTRQQREACLSYEAHKTLDFTA